MHRDYGRAGMYLRITINNLISIVTLNKKVMSAASMCTALILNDNQNNLNTVENICIYI